MVLRRYLLVVVFLTLFGAIAFVLRLGDKQHLKQVDDWIYVSTTPEAKYPGTSPCTEHMDWLEPYQFSYPIQYVSRDIITAPSTEGKRPSLTAVDEPLFDAFTTVDMAQSTTANIEHCLPPLTLAVPRIQTRPPDASNMIFGLQTTLDRLKDTVKHLERWLPHTNACLYAIVIENEETPADDKAIADLQKVFHDKAMNVRILQPVRQTDSFAQRYFSLVDVMYNARSNKTQWTICIDDDTFFPSMHDLQRLLSKFDATKPYYIGSLSENWWAVNHYGLMGFGGAGIMLSLPLAKVIHDHNDECKEHLRTTSGDVSIMDCIYQFSTTKLTHIPGLHQVDMHGDLSGFYESGREMLSLHHWKDGSAAGYKLEMDKMHLVADICDSCFLQRWQFPNEYVLTNGFSITHYPQGHLSGKKPGGLLGTAQLDKINMDAMEQTWGDEINVLHSLAPVRDRMTEDAKISFKLLDSMLVDSDEDHIKDTVRQVYFREGAEKEGIGKDQDIVMVLNWRKDLELPVDPAYEPLSA